MFEIGFSELLLVGVVALLVFGPERLPHAARTAGHWIGRIKRQFNSFKADIERDLEIEELRNQLQASQKKAEQLHQDIRVSLLPPKLTEQSESAQPATRTEKSE